MFSARSLASRFAPCLGAFLLAAALPAAQAQDDWPNKPITWLVGWPAGGSADVASRLIAERLERSLGQTVLIDNRPGASGTIALRQAANAAADGYTLVTVPGPVLLNTPSPQIGAELDAVATIAKGPMVLVAPASQPHATLLDMLQDAKKRPEAYSYASSGTGTSQHLGGELLKQISGAPLMHIPYKGGSQAVADVVGGQLPLAMLGITPVLPHIKAGRLKAYGVSTAERSAALPDVPTLAEAGATGFDASQWFVVAAPKGVPTERIGRLNQAINDALAAPQVVQGLAAVGVVAAPASAAETESFVKDELVRWRDVARKAKLDLE